jgi:hypothetical protein
MTPDVFISYAREDSDAADVVERRLEASGLGCYRDTKLKPGTPEWEDGIVRALGECSLVVLLLSRHSVASKFVRRELALADDDGKGCVPVFLERDIPLPPGVKLRIASRQRLYAEPFLEAVLGELESAVREAVDAHRNRRAYLASEAVVARATSSRRFVFSQERCGLTIEDNERGSRSLEAAAYSIQTRPEAYLGSFLSSLPRMADFAIEVSMTKVAGQDASWFGIEFGEQWPGDYYQFLLNGSGCVRTSRHSRRVWQQLGEHTGLRYVHTGNATNMLRVVRHREEIHIFVNGLHALSAVDRGVRTGLVGFVAGPDLHMRFADCTLAAVEPHVLLERAWTHWSQLEVLEARRLAREVAALDSEFEAEKVRPLLVEVRPDWRRTVLIAIGYRIQPQIHDSLSAGKLLQAINRLGNLEELQSGLMVTDKGLAEEEIFLKCPLIAVGGPLNNGLTRLLNDRLPLDSISTDSIKLRHDIDKGDRHAAVWGETADDTVRAVDVFIASGLLGRYLKLIWGGKT